MSRSSSESRQPCHAVAITHQASQASITAGLPFATLPTLGRLAMARTYAGEQGVAGPHKALASAAGLDAAWRGSRVAIR